MLNVVQGVGHVYQLGLAQSTVGLAGPLEIDIERCDDGWIYNSRRLLEFVAPEETFEFEPLLRQVSRTSPQSARQCEPAILTRRELRSSTEAV